ncbi:hypothetical protein ACFFLS_10435 [Flavobacterium procerum]|uniref:Uncharacterized protein n=1 Tax=Flavobacterium procerum TaxID=1455569 RepID=A0ABV6BTT0_9FLAO
MKKHITIFFVVVISLNTFAQVGMTTNNPNKNAILDLNNSDGTTTKGLLLPLVSLSSTTNSAPLSAPVEGMHVYNTRTYGSGTTQVIPGEYYNNGTGWIRIQSESWKLQGNTDTNTANNFAGTKDAIPLVFRTNNVERLRITSTGKLLIGTTAVPTGGTNAKVVIDNGAVKGAVQLKDGTEGNNFILTSNADGVATWKAPATEIDFVSSYGSGINLPVSPLNKWYFTGSSVTLAPGKWLISANMLLSKSTGYTNATESWWVNSSFSDSDTVLSISADIINGSLISGSAVPNSLYGILSGSTLINNTSGSNKTYYYIARVAQASSTATGELQNFGGGWPDDNISIQAAD